MSANLLLSTSRLILFGPHQPDEIRLSSIIKRKMVNLGRSLMGLPPNKGPGFWEWIKKLLWSLWARLWTSKRELNLPADMPEKLFLTIDGVLRNRGGFDKNADSAPNFWATPRGCISSPFFWSIQVEYSPHVDPSKVYTFESSLEDQLSRAGFDYNVRIQLKPLRIEIDKPKPPAVKLANLWAEAAAMKTNQRTVVLGQCWRRGTVNTLYVNLAGEDFSAFVAGAPGSGKTQLSMSLLLTAALTNSPESMSMVIVDPKAIDFRPFAELPHLARAIITEPVAAAEAIAGLVAEMDKRTKAAADGDVSFLRHSILLYVDELSDLLNSLPSVQAEKLAVNLQRLAQKGRGVGFIVVGATQRVYDVPASAHSKLNMRIVGKMRNANDSVSASGVPGTATNKLPGRGSFELFSSEHQGLRIQAPFVADSTKDGYEQEIGRFIKDIRDRWIGQLPGWRPEAAEAEAEVAPASQEMIALFEKIAEAEEPTQRAVRRAHQEVFGRDCNPKRAAKLLESFLAWSTNSAIKVAEVAS